jgi:galactose mutarotase-like enzyme
LVIPETAEQFMKGAWGIQQDCFLNDPEANPRTIFYFGLLVLALVIYHAKSMIIKHNGFDVYRLRADDGLSEVEVVPALGAIVSALRLPWAGTLREVLYRHPFFWEPHADRTRGGFPFLFPVCGRLERDGVTGHYLHDGHVYQMKPHGFSMRMPWEVVESTESSLTVRLRDTAETRLQYPFAFEVTLRYSTRCGAFFVDQEYANTGTDPLPYYAGFHPYYLTPAPGDGKDRTRIRYKAKSQLRYNARLTDILGREAPPVLPQSITAPEINERLTEVAPGTDVELIYPDGMVLHTVAGGAEDPHLFPFVQLYTMNECPFFCVEPWMGFPNALNTVKGCRWLIPGQRERGHLRVWTAQHDEREGGVMGP